jgi:hypothetical protein
MAGYFLFMRKEEKFERTGKREKFKIGFMEYS